MIIYKLKDIPNSVYDIVGGKAKGLKELIQIGLDVPEGFIVADLKREEDYAFAEDYYYRSGLRYVAVRSSITTSDDMEYSAAGQLETVLNISDRKKLIAAIKKAIHSQQNPVCDSYTNYFRGIKRGGMAVVVQQMVDAKLCGVCFSHNILGSSKEIVIEATRGNGEGRGSGKAKIRSYYVSHEDQEEIDPILDSCSYKVRSTGGTNKLLSIQQITDICLGAKKAHRFYGYPVELEWVIDKNGDLFWLQVRPITTTKNVLPTELDSQVAQRDCIYVGGRLASLGAVTPLTLSTTVFALDNAIRTLLVKSGAYTSQRQLSDVSCVASFSGHLFINLSLLYRLTSTTLGITKKQIDMGICQRVLNTPPMASEKKSIMSRVQNGLKYYGTIFSYKRAIKRMDALVERLNIVQSEDAQTLYHNISDSIGSLSLATQLACIVWMHAMTVANKLTDIIGQVYKEEALAREVYETLVEKPNEIDSLSIHQAMLEVAREAVRQYSAAADFSEQRLLEVIKADDKKIRSAYLDFISLHGHRCSREIELRSKSWSNDELPLMRRILALLKQGAKEPQRQESKIERFTKELLRAQRSGKKTVTRLLIGQARAGVRNLDYIMSKYIRVVDVFKQAYSRLGEQMVKQKIIQDKDLIYFLTHDEIEALIVENQAKYVKLAVRRKKLLAVQECTEFNDIYIDKPYPVCVNFKKQIPLRESTDHQSSVAAVEKNSLDSSTQCVDLDGQSEGGIISIDGTPLSHGEILGRARLVKTKEDARMLQKGEIMIVSHLDIGWSAYFSIAAGLVSESGSALSSLSIVAREYGIPLISDAVSATKQIRTGDYIHIDTKKAVVTIYR